MILPIDVNSVEYSILLSAEIWVFFEIETLFLNHVW